MAVCGSRTATQLTLRSAGVEGLGAPMARAATLPRGISLHGDRYRVRLTVDGEIHSLGVYDTLTDAKAALAIAKAEKVRGTFVPPARVRAERRAEAERIERESVTLDRWAEQWLGHLREQGGAESSIVTHRSVLRAHVLPVLGQARLVDIAPSDIDELIAGVRARPSKRNPRAKANGVAPNVLRTLRACLNVAVKRGLLPVSPVRAEVPARRVRPVDPDGDVATPAEIAAMTQAMPEHMRVAIPLAAWCSLRLGEVLGLQRGDFVHLDEPDRALLHVRRQVNSKAPGAPLTPPKADSVRSIAIPSFMLEPLVEHLAEHVGAGRDAPVLAHPSRRLERISQTTFDRHWRAARTAARRPTFRFHDLRHTGLTMYAQQGATLAELLHRGGHTDVSVALRYQHATAERDRALTKRLAAALGWGGPGS